jgi:hypothetical protein
MSDFFRKLRKTVKEIEKIADDFEEEVGETDIKESKNDYGRDTPRQLSMIDLRERLGLEELARITGLPFDTYNDYLDEEWVGGVYTMSDPSYHTYFQVWFARKDADGYNPDGVLGYYKEVMPDLHVVDDIGDEAFWVDSKTLFVHKGEDVIQASTNSDSELNLETIRTLVRKII